MTTEVTDVASPPIQSALDPRHYDPSWRRIWAATNSRTNPSDQIPTDTAAKKSLAIAAYTQEMTLAAILLSQIQGNQIDPIVIDSGRKALECIYQQAGFPDPRATRQVLENQITKRLADEKSQGVNSGIN